MSTEQCLQMVYILSSGPQKWNLVISRQFFLYSVSICPQRKSIFSEFCELFILKVDGSVCVMCENFLLCFNKNYNWKSAKALKQVGKKYTFYSEGLLRLLLIIKLLTSSPQSKIQFLQALHEVGRVSELGHLKLAHVSWSANCQDSVSRNQLTSAYVSQGVHVWADDWNPFYLGRALFWSLFLSSIMQVWPKKWHF